MAIGIEQLREAILTRHLITPVLDLDRQVSEGSVDVRLGHQFLIFNRATGLTAINPRNRETLTRELQGHHQRLLQISYGREFYLHPGDFVIARTFEYLNLPSNWLAYVVGRSSWGRLGIVIATATFVNPGFKGTITLEIGNLGQVPVVLVPLMRIAQLVFHEI